MEPIDVSKKKDIENILIPTLDASIVQLAKIRKRQPPKCRQKAREIASNVIQYYSKVCVKRDNRLKEQLSSGHQQKSQSTDCIPDDLNGFLKVIRKSLADRKEIMQALKIWTESQERDHKLKQLSDEKLEGQEMDHEIKQLSNENLSLIFLQGTERNSSTGNSCMDYHFSDNPDFIANENF